MAVLLIATVLIVETDDVVFTEIPARLHLDYFQRNLARVVEPVRDAVSTRQPTIQAQALRLPE
jgi:hypothetical protein